VINSGKNSKKTSSISLIGSLSVNNSPIKSKKAMTIVHPIAAIKPSFVINGKKRISIKK
jgi:hypothetical protein